MTTTTEGAPTISVQDAAPARPRWQVILIRPETMTFILLVLAFVVSSHLSPYFLDINYILQSFTNSAEFALVALVMTMIIISGEIDLSPASTMALSACLFAYTYQAGLPLSLAVGVSLVSGIALGLFNGLLVITLQLPSIIVTIGTLTLYRGLAQVMAGDESIRLPDYFVGLRSSWGLFLAPASGAGRSTRSAPTKWRPVMPASARRA
jgi:rhamnose transport system permease protein